MKNRIIIAVAFTVVIAFTLFVFLSRDSKAAVFTVTDSDLQIKCAFGMTVPLVEITSLKLVDSMPVVDKKLNGAGVGQSYKGEFSFQNGDRATLFVDATKPPFIQFLRDGKTMYINSDTPDKTKALYEQLKPVPK